MKLILIVLLALPLLADNITGSHPRLHMPAARLTFYQSQKTANTIYWQRLKSRCDSLIDANAAGGASLTTSSIMWCAGLISQIDNTLTHSGTRHNGEKYARITWIYAGAASPSTTCVNDYDPWRDRCTGMAIAYDWAYHDQTGSATEVAAVLSQITNQCAITPAAIGGISMNPNVSSGGYMHAMSSCVASYGDDANAQTNYNTLRSSLETVFSARMSGVFGGGSNAEGIEYGRQTILQLVRIMDFVFTGTGENLSTAWNPDWPNDVAGALYAWTTPSGRTATFSYTAVGSTFSCTGCTRYEMMGYGDDQNAENNATAVRSEMLGYRQAALWLMLFFREYGETTLSENMNYWLQTFLPYWSYSTSNAYSANYDPYVMDFLTIDPAQSATNYNITSDLCEYVSGMGQLICKSDKTADAIHVMMQGGGGAGFFHYHAEAGGALQIYANKTWALAEIPGYGNAWGATVRHNNILPNGHGAVLDGNLGWQGSASTPSSPFGSTVYEEHAGYVAARNNSTTAYKFSSSSAATDCDATNCVLRDVVLPTTGGLVAVLDRVKLAAGISGPSPQIWNCPPLKTILRSTTYNATNFSDWVGQPTPQNGHLYKITTAGTTTGVQPSFNTGAGSTTADGTAIWTEAGENCTISSNNFQVNFAASSQTNPVVFQQNATYGTVLPSATAVLAIRDNTRQNISAVRDVSNPSPLRFQMDRFYSGGSTTGVYNGASRELSGFTGACSPINGTWTISVPNQTSADGRHAYFTIPLDATGLGMNGCIGQVGLFNTNTGSALGYHITAEKNAFSNTASYLTILQPGALSVAKKTITERAGTNYIVGESADNAQLFAGKTLVAASCAGSYAYGSGTLTHIVFGLDVGDTCWYSASAGTVTLDDSNPGGYTSATADAAGSFSFVTSDSPGVLTSFTVVCPTTPIVAGVSQNCVITAKDELGNTLTSYTGSPTCTTGDAQAVIGSCASFVSGAKTVSLVLKTSPGPYTLCATDGVPTGCSSAITVNAAAAASCTLSGLATPRTAGIAGTITGLSFDAYGNAAVRTGDDTLTSTDGAATLPAPAVCGLSVCGYSVTLNTAGTQSITLTNAGGSFNCSQSGITVNAASGVNYLKAK